MPQVHLHGKPPTDRRVKWCGIGSDAHSAPAAERRDALGLHVRADSKLLVARTGGASEFAGDIGGHQFKGFYERTNAIDGLAAVRRAEHIRALGQPYSSPSAYNIERRPSANGN